MARKLQILAVRAFDPGYQLARSPKHRGHLLTGAVRKPCDELIPSWSFFAATGQRHLDTQYERPRRKESPR